MPCCTGNWSGRFFTLVLGIAVMVGLLAYQTESSVKAEDKEAKVLRHVVMFKFKDASSADEVQSVVDAFRKLPSKIPGIAEFEYGENNSPEGLADGFTHCFLVTFKSEEDRKVYLPHKEHQGFVEVLKPHLDKVLVFDYWAGK